MVAYDGGQAIVALAHVRYPGNRVVVDLFRGTGVSFPYFFPKTGSDGLLIGVDGSADMLDKARRRAARLGLDASPIHLLARDVQPGFLEDALPDGKTPRLLITLALGVFEEYEMIFANLYDAMPDGTRFALMEVFAEKGTRGAWLLDLVGQADVSRRVWEPLKARLSAYQEEWLPAHFWLFIKSLQVVASGVNTLLSKSAQAIRRTEEGSSFARSL